MIVRSFNKESLPTPRGFENFTLPSGALDLEIGAGVGYFAIQHAKNNPERKLISIEHTKEKFSKFESRIAGNKELSNLIPVHANAISWASHYLPPESVDLVVTDPPYGISYKTYRRGKKHKFANMIENDDNLDWIAGWFKQLYRVMKNDSAAYVFCSWRHHPCIPTFCRSFPIKIFFPFVQYIVSRCLYINS